MIQHTSVVIPPSAAGVASDVPPLDARALGPLAQQAVDALLREGEAANTVASYRAALRYWAAWYALRYRGAETYVQIADGAEAPPRDVVVQIGIVDGTRVQVSGALEAGQEVLLQ